MILIAFTWLVLLVFFIPTGITFTALLKIKTTDRYIPIFLGAFLQCLGLTICSFFFKIGLLVFIFNFLIITGFSIWKSQEIKNSLQEIKIDLKSLSRSSKFILSTLFLFSLFKCAQQPFVIDNESYYLQTIKWINEYGFVKGLANLHIYLGQTSPFHVLQAGFNFSFLTDRINDINGFFLVLSSIYFITEFEKRYSKNGEIHWIGYILIFNILFFQFINAPSPDLSIILISQIFFYYFLEKEDSLNNFKIISLLFLYILLIKITIAPFGLLLVYLLHFDKKRISFLLVFGMIIVSIMIIKNLIVSGYPFYPFDILPLNSDWKLPQDLLDYTATITKKSGYIENGKLHSSLLLNLNSWLHLGGIKRVFNLGILLLFGFGFFIIKFKKQFKYTLLYVILAINFTIILIISPQFRYFLPEFIFLSILTISVFFTFLKLKMKLIQYILLSSIILPLLIINLIDYKLFTSNKLLQQKEKYNWSQILIPEKNSKYPEIAFEKITEGNLNYYSPKENFFFYGTANGNLPCVNKVQLNYFKKKYHIIPQLRTSDLSDGFYSKKLSLNDSIRTQILP